MGSRLIVNDSKNGWLATLGCCAPRNYNNHDDEEDFEPRGRKSLEAGTLVFDQPRAISPPRTLQQEPVRPLTSYSMGQAISSWVESGRDMATRASSRASTMRTRTWTGHSRQSRPTFSISAPSDFRRLDERDAMPPVRRRRSFRPLELSIYLPENRLSPLPDFNLSDWDRTLLELECPAPALLRSRPSSLSTNASGFSIPRKPVGSTIDLDDNFSFSGHSRSNSRLSLAATTVDINVSRPPSVPWVDPLSSHPPTPPAHQTVHSRSDTLLSLPAPPKPVSRLNAPSPTPSFRSRSMTEPARGRATPSPTPPPKRPSIRRQNTSSVDDAIRELNTIVEERRAADAYLSSAHSLSSRGVPPSPSHHIPAIAPSLRMHVRSETLSDIGSAFSVPLPKALPSAPQTPFTPITPGEKRPLMLAKSWNPPHSVQEVDECPDMMDDTPSRPSTSASLLTFSSTKSSLSLWLRRQNRSKKEQLPQWRMPSQPSTTTATAANEAQPFYQCTAVMPTPRQRRTHHDSISSVSTYSSSAPSLSGRTTETVETSVISPISSPDTPPTVMYSAFGKEVAPAAIPPRIAARQFVDEASLISPLTPNKVGLAF